MEIQKELFNQIKLKVDPNLRMADVIGELLEIGSDSTYRRIRGTKELSISEMAKLCNHFNISIDSLCNINNGNIPFNYSTLDFADTKAYENYMYNISILYNNLLKSNNKEFIITAQDIPIFHFMPYPELVFFKLYAWNQSYSEKRICFHDFVAQLDREKLTEYYNNIFNVYTQVPSIEVWSLHTILPLINLLSYYIDISCFKDKDTPLLLCYQFIQLIENIEKWASDCCKIHKGIKSDFSLYLSPIDMQNDFIITKSESTKTTSLKLFTINAIFSKDENFNNETEKWIKQIISKSSMLSGASERERFKFFQTIKNRINNLIETIDNDNFL